MLIQELIPLGPKTTMRIGGQARYFAEPLTREDIEEAWQFARSKNMPLLTLGGGSNTVFAEGIIEAVVIRLKADLLTIEENTVVVQCGKILGSLLNDLAKANLDLCALTGIPGTVGGAIFGNAGQGPAGIWIDAFLQSVTFFQEGHWKIFSKNECNFRYRESIFKEISPPPILFEATLKIPSRPEADVKAEIEKLLKKRIETQPHIKTAGSCFKALPDGTPAWKLIEAAGLRGVKIGGIQISEKHANFLLNIEKATFDDVLSAARLVREKVPQIAGIEMRLYDQKGKIVAL